MATLIGDYGPSHSAGFHTMITTQGLPYPPQHQDSTRYRSDSHSRDSTPRRHPSNRQKSPTRSSAQTQRDWDTSAAAAGSGSGDQSGASRLPSPPDSSSPSDSAGSASRSEDNAELQAHAVSQNGEKQAYMESSARRSALGSAAVNLAKPSSSCSTATQSQTNLVNQSIPSPASESGDRWYSTKLVSGLLSSECAVEQKIIHVRDLAHIETLARTEMQLSGNGVTDPPLQAMKYEISGMPICDIIEMVAALLTKITTTNDLQHDALSRNAVERNASHVRQAQAQNDGSVNEHSMSPMSSSVLAFHGKNVPAITILSYLSRIHKYCPTTYEVFLSLLVYFDRMTERVNDIVMKAEEAKKAGQAPAPAQSDIVMKDRPASSHSDELDEDIADDDTDSGDEACRSAAKSAASREDGQPASDADSATSQPTFFVVDSFNIHRLIIAGVTCASKFFSDVFYTNSRYAKVGGLPLTELNHLEIQFLLLNDFRLAVPVEDLEAYATMLVEFYAREVVAPRTLAATTGAAAATPRTTAPTAAASGPA